MIMMKKKTLEFREMIIVVRGVFPENKYYSQFFLDEYLYKLKMLKYGKITA